jgi:cytochrome P450
MSEPRDILTQLIVELFRRTRLDPGARDPRIGKAFVVDTPTEAAQVLDNPDLFAKDFALLSAFGPSRFNLNGDTWRKLRPRTQRVYAQMGRPLMQAEVTRIYAAALDRTAPDAVSLEDALSRAAITVFFAAFGVNPDVEPFLAHFAGFRDIAAELQQQSWRSSSQSERADAQARAAQTLVSFGSLITGQAPVAALVKRLADVEPAVPSEVMLSDFMTNLIAGIETTTAALGWMIDALGRNAALQAALRAEALESQTEGALLASFRDECLRVFSPIPFVIRQVTAPVPLGSQQLDEGDLVLLSLIGLHRDAGSWDAPQEFHARRADFAPGAAPNPAFRPFLTGPRACGGRRIAEMELTAALVGLLQRFDFESPKEPTGFIYAVAFRPVLTPAHRVIPRG